MVVKILSSYLHDTASFRDVSNFYQGNFNSKEFGIILSPNI